MSRLIDGIMARLSSLAMLLTRSAFQQSLNGCTYLNLAQMLPFGGQGSNQAIEDGGALGKLLQGVNDTSELSKRLDLFVQLRRNRASRTQALSKFRIGMEKAAEAELMLYIDNPGDGEPCREDWNPSTNIFADS